MNFLYDLTRSGNVLQANRWGITSYILSMGRKRDNPMTELGLKVAERVLQREGDVGTTAAVLLLIALDSAYNPVLAVSHL